MTRKPRRTIKQISAFTASTCAALLIGSTAAGATGLSDGSTYPYDTTPPTVPTDITLAPTTDGTMLIDWAASTDDASGVRSYLVYVDGAYATWTYDTSVEIAASSNSTIQLRATDRAGNRSSKSDGVSVDGPDTTAPSVPSGLQIELLSNGSYELRWEPSADNVEVRSYLVYVNDRYHTWTYGTSTTLDVPLGGRWNVRVLAVDTSGNRSDKSEQIVVGDTPQDLTPPTAPTDLVLQGGAVIEGGDIYRIGWTPASDESGILGYEIYVDGRFTSYQGGQSDHGFVTLYDDRVGASVLIEVRAVDIHRNVGPAGSITIEPT